MKEAQQAIQKEIKQRESRIKQNLAENNHLQGEIKELKRALALVGGKAKSTRKKRTGPSIPDLVEEVLKAAGKPLHVKEIAEKIGVETARISAGLQKFIKEGRRFERTARATFGLAPAKKKEPRKPGKGEKKEAEKAEK